MKQFNSAPFFALLFVLCAWSTVSVAQQQGPLDVALRHLEKSRDQLQLTEADLGNYRVSDLYSSRHNGVTHVYLQQEYAGIAVEQAITNVNILPDGQVLSMGNRFVSDLQSRINTTTPTLSPAEAIEAVLLHFQKRTDVTVKLQEKINDQYYVFSPDGFALEPVPVRLVYQTMEDRSVRLAWRVELYELDAYNWWNARIDAQTGAVLAHHNQVIHCEFDHSSECSVPHTHAPITTKFGPKTPAIPKAHPHALTATEPAPKAAAAPKAHPHAHGPVAAMSAPKTTASPLAKTNARANSYRVYPVPIESPIHGNRDLITDPSDPIASPFGWHDVNGATGAEYTITRGNNVHAYHDIFNQNESAGDEPDGGPSLDFDYPLDLSTEKPYTQVDPAVVNLFYWNNVMHDMWYQYGFDEASGNFQVNNYNNGGIEGDYVRAEALDGSGRNNANFGTGADGSGARMQMYIWTDEQLPPNAAVIVEEPATVAGTYVMVPAGFGAEVPTPPLAGKVVLADDGIGNGADVCEDIINGAELSGNIAMIDRGDCEFGFKSLAAENEGAIAVIICNNDGTPPFGMAPGVVGDQVTIPAVMMSRDDCNTLKVALDDELQVRLSVNAQIPVPGPTAIDGDLDNGIIIHEYTHGISIRLTGGPSQGGGCLSNREQAGEGWSDWFALAMLTTENDIAEQRRGIGTYALREPTSGTGIRRYPYSRDMDIDPHTYASVVVEQAPHGVGSVWAVTIWDLYWDLIDEYGFSSDFYFGDKGNNIAMQLVLDGLKLQPCNPTFLDSRDAIIAADVANNGGANVCLIWKTFARRGMGFSARAGGNESFDMPDACSQILKIKKTAVASAEAGDVVTYTLEITNDTPGLLTDISVSDLIPEGTSYVEGSSSCPNTTFANGEITIELGSMMTGNSTICTYQLQLADEPFSVVALEDGVEAGTDNWRLENPVGAAEWSVVSNNPFEGDNAWFAPDIETESDQYLILSESVLLDGDSPALSFWHWYNTEATWDGGVVEISTDEGLTWEDLGSEMTQNGYNSTIEVNQASTISGREAFSGNSNGYLQTVIDLSSYSGQSVIFRFRMACDGAVGGEGWYVDNVEFFDNFYSITNTACVTSSTSTGEACAEAVTIVTGELDTSTDDPASGLDIALYPNPAQDVVYLSLRDLDRGAAVIRLMSVDGRELLTRELEEADASLTLNIAEVPAGIHFLEVQTETAKVVRKLVVQ
ncbi:MAG: T9SS-dependent M36 family metallopeptidase [Bacteroidota bacterium]